jgi:hypothetical protein
VPWGLLGKSPWPSVQVLWSAVLAAPALLLPQVVRLFGFSASRPRPAVKAGGQVLLSTPALLLPQVVRLCAHCYREWSSSFPTSTAGSLPPLACSPPAPDFLSRSDICIRPHTKPFLHLLQMKISCRSESNIISLVILDSCTTHSPWGNCQQAGQPFQGINGLHEIIASIGQ